MAVWMDRYELILNRESSSAYHGRPALLVMGMPGDNLCRSCFDDLSILPRCTLQRPYAWLFSRVPRIATLSLSVWDWRHDGRGRDNSDLLDGKSQSRGDTSCSSLLLCYCTKAGESRRLPDVNFWVERCIHRPTLCSLADSRLHLLYSPNRRS